MHGSGLVVVIPILTLEVSSCEGFPNDFPTSGLQVGSRLAAVSIYFPKKTCFQVHSTACVALSLCPHIPLITFLGMFQIFFPEPFNVRCIFDHFDRLRDLFHPKPTCHV